MLKDITKMKILITGANGFVGHALIAEAVSRGIEVRGITRVSGDLPMNFENFVVGDIDGNTNWRNGLMGCKTVIHLAARAHVVTDSATNPLEEYRKINVQGTLNLARQAVRVGVRRFLFISSIKVNGEATQLEHPFKADDTPAPLDAYGVSKMEAEQGLLEIAQHSGMEVVIIRPPLVYGPGVKGNLAVMIRWIKRGVPMPLGAIHNQRSLVSLDNLVDLIITCITHPAAANQIFLVSDGEDVSTTELLRGMGKSLGLKVRLLPVPVSWLKLLAAMVGKQDMAQRLCGSLQVDIEKTRRLLNWKPLKSLDESLNKAPKGVSL